MSTYRGIIGLARDHAVLVVVAEGVGVSGLGALVGDGWDVFVHGHDSFRSIGITGADIKARTDSVPYVPFYHYTT